MSMFWKEVEISPIDLSYIRIDLFKKYSLGKMNIGDTLNIQTQEGGEWIKYTITKKDNEGYIFKAFEIKKFVFNQALFNMEVEKGIVYK